MLSALCVGGADAAAFFETTGPRGIMENGGPVFPVYHVFRAIAGFEHAFPIEISEPFKVAALAIGQSQIRRLILANYHPRRTRRDSAPKFPRKIRRLNADTAIPALEQPDTFWNKTVKRSSTTQPSALARSE